MSRQRFPHDEAVRRLSPAQWARIDGGHGPRERNGCIPWQRAGRATLGRIYVARAVLYRQTGVFGEVAMHACDNPNCVSLEPGHLHWGTTAENVADMVAKGRQSQGASHAAAVRPARRARAKLTENDVSAIRAMRGQATQAEIGRKFGVSQSMVSAVLRGAVWQEASW